MAKRRYDPDRARKAGRARKLSFSFGANRGPSTANVRSKKGRSGKGGGS